MITKPVPFQDAVRFLLEKEQLPAEWDAREWQAQEPDFRKRAFWSAKIENARFIDRAQGLIFDYLAEVRDDVTTPDGARMTALRVGGREHFVKLMRDFMISEGMAKESEFKTVNQKDITDIRSLSRLRLMFDTNVRQSYGFGQWKQGMTPAVLAAYPAAKLIRDRGVKEPRPRHQANLGEIRLKTDPRWALFHNDPEIGGFGVPWGPYGFNSGVTQEDVSRAKAARLGLDVDSVAPRPASALDGLRASVKGMDPALKAKLMEELRAGPSADDAIDAAREAGRKAAAGARREMLHRGLTDAVGRGDAALAEKYRAAIAGLTTSDAMRVMDDGDKIILETSADPGILPLLQDEISPTISKGNEMEGLPFDPERSGEDKGTDPRATAQAVRSASKSVYPGWTIPESDRDTGSVAERAIEAQIAAAVEGRKPLYFEPWGNPEIADKFAQSYRSVLPHDVEVMSRDGMLFIYRPETVVPIMDSDSGFYRLPEESVIDSIARVSGNGMNGELLGYGARHMREKPAHEVRIYRGDDLMLYFFVSDPDEMLASRIADERSKDFIRAFGWNDVRFELTRRD